MQAGTVSFSLPKKTKIMLYYERFRNKACAYTFPLERFYSGQEPMLYLYIG